MRVPLSWLRDFAPLVGEPADLAATLDDLGLVVEEMEVVGEGLGDVVVVRVEEISPIEGADRIGGWWSTTATGPSTWCAGHGTSRRATWFRWPRWAPCFPGASRSVAGR